MNDTIRDEFEAWVVIEFGTAMTTKTLKTMRVIDEDGIEGYGENGVGYRGSQVEILLSSMWLAWKAARCGWGEM